MSGSGRIEELLMGPLPFDAQAIGSSLAAGGQVNAHTYAIFFLGDAASY